MNRTLLERANDQTSIHHEFAKAKGVISKVIAMLKGTSGAPETNALASRFVEVKAQMEKWTAEHDKIKDELREHVEGLFEAEHAVLTRVVQTAELVITMDKLKTRTLTNVDEAKFHGELDRIMPGLSKKVEEIRKACVVIREIPVKSNVSVRQNEGLVSEGVFDKIKEIGRRLHTAFTSWGRTYDHELNQIKQHAMAHHR